jgi:integrase
MTRAEIDRNGIWEIPAARYKTKRPHAVPLSAAALKLIEAQPKAGASGAYVFSSKVGTAFAGFDNAKAVLDAAIGAAAKKAEINPPPHWTLHDLRRTAKTLMARAGVRPDISERVLGHVIAGVEGV